MAPAPSVGTAVKPAPVVTVKVELADSEMLPPLPDVLPPIAVALSVVAVPAVSVPLVTCTEIAPPLPVVPPLAFSVRPLVLKVSVAPLSRMLLEGLTPTEPEPVAFADMVTAVPPAPRTSAPLAPVPIASSKIEPPKPLPADDTLKLAVVRCEMPELPLLVMEIMPP